MTTLFDGQLEQDGDLQLRSPAFEDGERMPDSTGYVNENASPPLSISGVPDETAALVLAVDHPDAEPIAGHAWTHWLVWDLPPDTTEVPENWDPRAATEGLNDYLETGYGGPSPPPGEAQTYRFKLAAIDAPLGAPAGTHKQRLGSLIALDGEVGAPIAAEAELLATTELTGTYAAEQGTLF